MQLTQQKEKYQNLLNEKEELKIQNESLKQNINILNNNKKELEQKLKNIKYQAEKQIKDLMNQIQNYKNNKIQLNNEIKIKDERLIALDKKLKEMALNYQKKFSDLKNNYSIDKNTNMLNYNEKLKVKEEEIMKLNVKIRSLEENTQILNDEKEINNIQNIEIEQSTEAKRKLLEQISSKDNQIFELKKELSDLKNKMITELNTRKTQNNELCEKIKFYQSQIDIWQVKYKTLEEEKNNFYNTHQNFYTKIPEMPESINKSSEKNVRRKSGKIITRKSQVNGIPEMKVRFADGEIEVEHHG